MKRIFDYLASLLDQPETVCDDCQALLDMLEAEEIRVAELELANRILTVNLEILRGKTERGI